MQARNPPQTSKKDSPLLSLLPGTVPCSGASGQPSFYAHLRAWRRASTGARTRAEVPPGPGGYAPACQPHAPQGRVFARPALLRPSRSAPRAPTGPGPRRGGGSDRIPPPSAPAAAPSHLPAPVTWGRHRRSPRAGREAERSPAGAAAAKVGPRGRCEAGAVLRGRVLGGRVLPPRAGFAPLARAFRVFLWARVRRRNAGTRCPEAGQRGTEAPGRF